MIVSRAESSRNRPSRRWLRRLLRFVPLMALFLAGGLIGAFLVHDAAGREWMRMNAYKLVHARNYGTALLSSSKLETLRIDIRDSQRLVIHEARTRAMREGILFSDEQPWVSAMIALDGTAVPVRIRLKGIYSDHRNTDKWSYRIRMPDHRPYMGMTTFSIQHAGTRDYLHEWIYLESMRAEGLLAPRYTFVDVVLNNAAHGLYAVEEHVTPEWLQTQGRREGVIIKFDDTDAWRQLLALGHHRGTVYPHGFNNLAIEEFHGRQVRNDDNLGVQRDAAFRSLLAFTRGERPGHEVFDLNQTATFLAMQELWSSHHVLGPPNARFYYNAVTGLLEPIAGDAAPEFDRPAMLVALPAYWQDRGDKRNHVYWSPRFLEHPRAAERYVQEMLRITEPSYIDALRSRLANEEHAYLTAMHREYPHVQPPWRGLHHRARQLRTMLSPSRTIVAYGQFDGHGVQLDVGNVLGLPVEVLEVRLGNEPPVATLPLLDRTAHPDHTTAMSLSDRSSVILSAKRFDEPIRFARLTVPVSRAGASHAAQAQPTVSVRTRILGHHEEQWIEARMGRHMVEGRSVPTPSTVEQLLEKHPFLQRNPQGDDLQVQPGEWIVGEDLALPAGTVLTILPDTTLRFSRDAALVARGPLHLQGSADGPITLEAADPEAGWPGIIVMQSPAISEMAHATIRHTRGIDRDGWVTPAGVTFHQSPAALNHVRFADISAAAAIALMHTEFDLRQMGITGCARDALLIEHSRGTVAYARLAGIPRDGIVIQGGRVNIHDSSASDIGRKAIAAGIDAHVDLQRIRIDRAHFGIVSKDLAFVFAEQIDLHHCEFGLAAYTRLAHFGPGNLNASSITTNNVAHPTLVHRDAFIKLQGNIIAGEPFDIHSLDGTASELVTAPQ